MNKFFFWILTIALCFSMGCASYGKFVPGTPLQSNSYVILYGKETCPACQKLERKLDEARINYVFKDTADANVQNELYPRMEQAGIDTDYYLLPVVDVNGNLASHPRLSELLELYRQPLKNTSKPEGSKPVTSTCPYCSKS